MSHIGIDARLIGYRMGGISTYIRRLVNALEAEKPTHRFTVIHSASSTDNACNRFRSAKVLTPPHHRLERLALSAELLRFNLDVLHSPDFIPPWRGAKKHVITVHDLTFLHFPQHKDRDSQRYYNDQIQFAVRQADHILAVSEASKIDLMTMLDVAEKKITVQPHGIDERFRPLTDDEKRASRQRLHLPEDYILFVGTLEPRKNIPGLLRAYEQLRNAPALLLVGQIGWLFEETVQYVKQLQSRGLPIIIRSDISDDDMPAIYNAASLLVVPSFYEGFGLPVLEAMACGIPVVASNNSSFPEVVGDAGLLVDPDKLEPEMIEFALENTEWREEASKKGIIRSKEFTWERSAEIALSVYESVV